MEIEKMAEVAIIISDATQGHAMIRGKVAPL